MLTTPHTLLALALMLIIPNKLLALLMAFLSHFITDFFLPHWNPSIYSEHKKNHKLILSTVRFIFFDAFLAVSLMVAVIFSKAWPDLKYSLLIAVGCLLAVLPDLVEIPYYFLNSSNKLIQKYVVFQHKHQAKAGKLGGILNQLIVIFFSLYAIYFS